MKITRSTRSLLATLAAGALITVGLAGCASEDAPDNSSNSSQESSNSSTSTDKKNEENNNSSDNKSEEKSVFTTTQNGVEMTLTYYAVGDDVVRQKTVNVIDYAAAGLADEAEARELFDPLIKDFQGVTGLDHQMEYGATSATETLVVDYTKADIAEISKLTGSSFSGDAGSDSVLSMKASRNMLIDAGFTEVK